MGARTQDRESAKFVFARTQNQHARARVLPSRSPANLFRFTVWSEESYPRQCLCGGVRFEVDPPFIRASHCHCDRCRKHSGTAVCTQARVRKEQFRRLQGEELIKVHGKGEGAVKAFCVNCGSSLFGGDWPEGPQVSIRMGAFDDDPGIRPQFHTYVDCRPPWDEITDQLPQYREGRTDD
jgi:hypothetical protein